MNRVLLITAVLLPLASASGAERRAVRLEYSAPATCPSEQLFRAQLAARLGYDPVIEPSTHVASVLVRPHDGLLEATFGLWEVGAPTHSDRSFSGPPGECDSLVSGVALALAIALDPRLLTRKAPEPPPAAPPPAATAPAPAPEVPRAPASRSQLAISLGARGDVGLLPQPSAGPSVEARLGFGTFSAALDAELLVAPTDEAAGGQVDASLVRGGLQLCGHLAFAALCARGSAGGLSAGGTGFATDRRGWQGVATVGPLALLSWRPLTTLVLQLSLALEVVLIRNALTLGSVELWRSPALAGTAGLSVGWQIW